MRHPVIALAACLFASMPVRANGRFPEAQTLVGGPPGASQVLAVRTTFGLVRSDDGGRRWTFLCEDLLGLANTSQWDAPLQLTGAGTLLAGVPDGLIRLADGCAPTRVPEVAGDFSADLTATRDGSLVLWVGSSGPSGNRVLASTDRGQTFTQRGTARDGILIETIDVSDRDPERVYASAAQLEPRAYLILRSDDGARSLRELPIARDDLAGAYIAGLDPRSPDVLWVRAPLRSDGGSVAPTALLRSDDGGSSFSEVARTAGPMQGFAVGDDGEVFFGGPDDGLWRGRVGSFRRVSDTPVTCLRVHEGALYACANHLRTGWAVARSVDGGASFAPLLRFESIEGAPTCAAGTTGGDICAGRWSVLRRTLVPDAGGASPVDAGGATVPPPSPTPGCGCAAPRARGSGALLVTLLAAGALARRRRRRAMLPPPCVAPPSR